DARPDAATGGPRAGDVQRRLRWRAREDPAARGAPRSRRRLTMAAFAYRIVNVFTRDGGPLTGNPLCVFEDGRGLDDATLQALARQFNLSETTFILPSDK